MSTKKLWALIFISPGIVWFSLFMAYPLYSIVNLSLHLWTGPNATNPFVGLANYVHIFRDPQFFAAMLRTFVVVVCVVPTVMILALLTSFLLTNIKKGAGFFRILYYLPSMTGVVAIGIIWQWIFEPSFGLLNALLLRLGLPGQRLLLDPKSAIFAVSFVKVWMRFGFNVVVYVAGLLSIPTTYYDAADIAGANAFQKFVRITIPLLMPITVMLSILNTIDSLKIIGEIYMLTAGGPAGSTKTVGFLMYETAFEYGWMGRASAMALVLFLITMLFTLIQRKLSNSEAFEY